VERTGQVRIVKRLDVSGSNPVGAFITVATATAQADGLLAKRTLTVAALSQQMYYMRKRNVTSAFAWVACAPNG
jgi:hypothetical protein